jgi:hypothetical protein
MFGPYPVPMSKMYRAALTMVYAMWSRTVNRSRSVGVTTKSSSEYTGCIKKNSVSDA